ncbi:MAG: tRNA dihydrouridine synthase DusB [Anaerolineae bacterium]
MKSLIKRPFKLGSLSLVSNIFCAPLAGCSDLPFRRMTSAYRPGLIYCEMVKMDALVRNDPHTFRLLDYESSMHPIGAQLCGSKPYLAGTCAKIIEDLGFDVIDLNCGCPVDKVTKDGSGSGLLKQPEIIGEILAEMIAAVKIPVTLKVRAGWDDEHLNAPLITQIAERAGAKAICIHGRTRAQGYKGPANWEYVRECKEVAREILVIGNGDIFNATAAFEMFEKTSCDAILIARGTMGQPWIIEDIYRQKEGLPTLKRNGIHVRSVLLEHFENILSYQNERKSILDMRRVGCFYLKRGHGTKKLKEGLNRARTTLEIYQLLNDYPWEETDFSGNAVSEEVETEAESCC